MSTITAPKCWNCETGFGIDAVAEFDSEHGPLCAFCAGLELDSNPDYIPTPLAVPALPVQDSRRDAVIVDQKIVQDAAKFIILAPFDGDQGHRHCRNCHQKGFRTEAAYVIENYSPAGTVRAVFSVQGVCESCATLLDGLGFFQG